MAKSVTNRLLQAQSRELIKQLSELPVKVQKKVAGESLKKAAAPIEAAAISNAPHDDGMLQDSIKTRVSTAGKSARADVVAEALHAHLVEDGTGPRIVKKTGRASGSMPANPFMGKAFDENIEKATQILEAELMSGIEKALA